MAIEDQSRTYSKISLKRSELVMESAARDVICVIRIADPKAAKLPTPPVATVGATTKLPIPEELKKAQPSVRSI